jgi:oligopeptide transport system substrate-binding protein
VRPTRSLRIAGLLAVLAVAGVGCRSDGEQTATPAPSEPSATATPSASPEPPSRTGGTLRYALSADPATIDPRFVVDDEGTVVVDALFDSLVALDEDLEVEPAAAEDWTVSDDGRIFTFTLREGATFHDGSPVTAEDFARSLNRIADGTADPRSFLAFHLAPIVGFNETQQDGRPLAGVQVIDDRTLEITLGQPFPEFLEVLARPSLAPTPAAAGEDPEGYALNPIGNGPFQMAQPWQRNQFIRVARFDDHWGEPAYLDDVVFRIYASDPAQETQFAEVVAGQVQFAQVPATKRQDAIEQFGISTDGYTGPGVLDGLSSTIYYYGFNTEAPPFDRPEVRRAISLLIDRESIAQEIMRDTRVPADAIVPPSIPGHQEGACDHCVYDPGAARAIIDELAAADEEFELGAITLRHNAGATHEAIAERIAIDIRTALEIEVTVAEQELEPYVQTLRAGEMELFRLGWQADHPSPGAYLYPLFSGSRKGIDNLTRYDVPEVNTLLDDARATADEAERRALYQQAERRILEDVAIAPVLFYRHDKVVAPEVRDLRYSPMGLVNLHEVWLDSQG